MANDLFILFPDSLNPASWSHDFSKLLSMSFRVNSALINESIEVTSKQTLRISLSKVPIRSITFLKLVNIWAK